jgi:lipopolysaccharide export LptBFGC system permease protein LptF
MPEVEELKEEIIATVDSDLDAWETFYKKYKEDYAKITRYQKKIEKLEEEIKYRDNVLKKKFEKEKGVLLLVTAVFIVISALFLQLISRSVNVWLYFIGGFMIGLGAFSLLYLYTR